MRLLVLGFPVWEGRNGKVKFLDRRKSCSGHLLCLHWIVEVCISRNSSFCLAVLLPLIFSFLKYVQNLWGHQPQNRYSEPIPYFSFSPNCPGLSVSIFSKNL